MRVTTHRQKHSDVRNTAQAPFNQASGKRPAPHRGKQTKVMTLLFNKHSPLFGTRPKNARYYPSPETQRRAQYSTSTL